MSTTNECENEGRGIEDTATKASEPGLDMGSFERLKKMHQIIVPKNEESSEVGKKTEISAEVDQALSNLSSRPDVMLQTFKVIIRVLSQQIICQSVPPIVNKLCLKELAVYNIKIVDDCEDPIEILIRADIAGKLMTGGRREIPCGLVAIETKLGWLVMRRMPNTSRSECTSSLSVTSLLSTVETITDLWTLDTLGITDPSVKKNQMELQEAARLHFLNTVHAVDNRFEVDLSWLEDHPPLPDYFDLAERRLNKTVKRLKTESIYEAYENVFKEWLEEGVTEEVSKNDQDKVLYFLIEKLSKRIVLQNSDRCSMFRPKYFSKYKRIVNLIAWILRFAYNCRSEQIERKHGNLDSDEIFQAEKLLIKMVQEDCFVNEKDEKLKTLGVFKDESGILRLKTKLTFREDTEEFKMPAVLPPNHEVVKRLVRYYHEKNAHAGTQILINILRERSWILNARKTVKSLINQCTVCRRFSAKNLETYTAPPPEDRLREAAVFEICGVDLAGPKILRGNKKSWICLFTCAVYREVHLETLIQQSGNRKSVTVNIGDVVLIGSDNTKRINWPLGKIIQILPGKDGIARLVKLKTSHGQLLRPIQRLYSFKVSNDDLIIEKFSTEKVGDETCENFASDDVCVSEPQIQKTRAGRTVKVPKRLDL
ncbi:hypothetical protein X975_11953, partial [Stegodyphus mimosarum]